MSAISRIAFPLGLALVLVACAHLTAVPESTVVQPPSPARRVDVVDREFGLVLPDPYRWMEGENNAEFDAWLKSQAAYARAKLDALPTLAFWRERLSAVAGATRGHSDHRIVRDRLFFLRRSGGTEAVLMYRDANGEHTIYDPNSEQGASIGNFSISPDARLVAINVGRSGSDIGDIELREVTSGKLFADKLEPVFDTFSPSWLPDSSGFVYTRMARVDGPDPQQGSAAYLHRIGQPQVADLMLARADGEPPLRIVPETRPIITLYPHSEWALLAIRQGRASFRLCEARRAQLAAIQPKWSCLADFDDDIQGAVLHGDTVYLLQGGAKHPNRHVLALKLRRLGATLASAHEVVAERADRVLQSIGAARDGLYLTSLHNGLSVLSKLDYGSTTIEEIALPFSGTADIWTDVDVDGGLLRLTGWTVPMTAYRFEPGKPLTDIGLGDVAPADYSDLVTDEIEAISADGTHVPLSVFHKGNLTLDGHALALISAYGGYGASITPSFSAIWNEWSEAGHVDAICHVRGGGEKGEAWRLGGRGANKQRGVEDFIACSRELEKRGYSTSARTAGFSASMGGVLVGGAYTTPGLAFGAMLIEVGVLNPSRLLAAKDGAEQIGELGDPRTEIGLKQLVAMDPVRRVKAGKQYPPLLLSVGLSDALVAPWNSGKFAASVMAASPSTPVWIRTEEGAGHISTTNSEKARKYADYFAWAEAMLSPDSAK